MGMLVEHGCIAYCCITWAVTEMTMDSIGLIRAVAVTWVVQGGLGLVQHCTCAGFPGLL